MKKILITPVLVLLLNLIFVTSVLAVGQSSNGGYQPLAPIPGLTGSSVPMTTATNGANGFSEYIKLLYKWGVSAASGLAVVVIMYGGVQYMTSAGGGGIEEAKGRIQGAVMGLLLALGSYIILQTINRDLLSTNFALETLSVDVVTGNKTLETAQTMAAFLAVNNAKNDVMAAKSQLDQASAQLRAAIDTGDEEQITGAQTYYNTTLKSYTDASSALQKKITEYNNSVKH